MNGLSLLVLCTALAAGQGAAPTWENGPLGETYTIRVPEDVLAALESKKDAFPVEVSSNDRNLRHFQILWGDTPSLARGRVPDDAVTYGWVPSDRYPSGHDFWIQMTPERFASFVDGVPVRGTVPTALSNISQVLVFVGTENPLPRQLIQSPNSQPPAPNFAAGDRDPPGRTNTISDPGSLAPQLSGTRFGRSASSRQPSLEESVATRRDEPIEGRQRNADTSGRGDDWRNLKDWGDAFRERVSNTARDLERRQDQNRYSNLDRIAAENRDDYRQQTRRDDRPADWDRDLYANRADYAREERGRVTRTVSNQDPQLQAPVNSTQYQRPAGPPLQNPYPQQQPNYSGWQQNVAQQPPPRIVQPQTQYVQAPPQPQYAAPTVAPSQPATQVTSPSAATTTVAAEDEVRPWGPLIFTTIALFTSLGANAFLGWLAWSFFWRFRDVASDVVRARSQTSAARQAA